MIRINNLTKIYKSKRRSRCKALDNINLTLPNKGLVFVLGKSGSGKSTLLNLIGGLDNITKGSIIVDGNNISYFNEKEFCDYRNTHIGFIFQDYHLIDELTVYENIVLSLNLRKIEDRGLVRNALKRVDLSGYEDRYPSELSGGERQRVAIARAIVKKPRIILADEPTGNLDTNTASQIINLLKELSKECLILIVSHNVNDAYSYSDRIIELSKGRVIKDQSKNPMYSDNVICHNNNIYYPGDKILNDNDINYINSNMNNNSKIIKMDNKYTPTMYQNINNEKVDIEKKRLSIFKELGLSLKFLKSKVLRIFFSSFMVSVIMVILALSQTIITFDSGEILEKEMKKSNQKSLVLTKKLDDETKQILNEDYHISIDEQDIQTFKNSGYDGKILPVLNVTLPIMYHENTAGLNNIRLYGQTPYLKESLGTFVIDEDFLINRFGKLEYVEKASYQEPDGFIITDYLADAILSLNSHYIGKSYKDIIGKYTKHGWSIPTFYINGIIKTDYKKTYEKFYEKLENKEFNDSSSLYQDKDFMEFSNDIFEKLGYCYSLNPNFVEDYENYGEDKVLFHQKLVFNDLLEFNVDRAKRNFFIRGEPSNNTIIGNFDYTKVAPEIPKDAKYIRVAYGWTQKDYTLNDEELNEILNMGNAILVFSDGTAPSDEQLSYKKGVWLDMYGREDGTAKDWPRSKVSDYIEIPDGTYIKEFTTYTYNNYSFCAFYNENKEFIDSYTTEDRVSLENGTMNMNYEDFNQIFNTKYTQDNLNQFVPVTVNLKQYRLYDYKNENALIDYNVTIKKLISTATQIDDTLAKLMRKNQIYYNAICFEGMNNIGDIISLSSELNYEYQSLALEGVYTMTKAVEVFIPIFELVAIFLCIGIIFILVSFSTKMIKDKMHDIGILKAIGTQSKTIGRIFGLQIILIAILTILMSTFGYFYFIDIANDVLIESLKRLAPTRVMLDLDFLTFKLSVVNINVILILLLGILSLFIPMLKIRKIKPVKIIKTKE